MGGLRQANLSPMHTKIKVMSVRLSSHPLVVTTRANGTALNMTKRNHKLVEVLVLWKREKPQPDPEGRRMMNISRTVSRTVWSPTRFGPWARKQGKPWCYKEVHGTWYLLTPGRTNICEKYDSARLPGNL